mmetsp:Transcript_32375/g.81814  ORF Transcript_32375/g.81814 Transcript_32375/m.81814 type:complete len:217 (+) Transcript_32375:192-842(+)
MPRSSRRGWHQLRRPQHGSRWHPAGRSRQVQGGAAWAPGGPMPAAVAATMVRQALVPRLPLGTMAILGSHLLRWQPLRHRGQRRRRRKRTSRRRFVSLHRRKAVGRRERRSRGGLLAAEGSANMQTTMTPASSSMGALGETLPQQTCRPLQRQQQQQQRHRWGFPGGVSGVMHRATASRSSRVRHRRSTVTRRRIGCSPARSWRSSRSDRAHVGTR